MNHIFDFVLKNYHLFYNSFKCEIYYGKNINNDSGIEIVQNVSYPFFDNKEDIKVENVIWKEWKGKNIPFCFDKDDNKDIITQVGNKITINYDIIASSFYFLSGWNEYINPQKDAFGRISYKDSIIKKLDICLLPVVNYYFDILNEAVFLSTGKNGNKTLWFDNKFGVALTHDIDSCKSAWFQGSFSELKKKNFLSIPLLILKRIFSKDDWFNFDLISSIEKRHNASSSFYFLPEKGKSGNLQNADYNIKSKNIQRAIEILKEQGNDIGVHGSFGTHIDSNKLTENVKRIDINDIIGNRFHFLMFDAGLTVDVLEKTGIKYDTSLGFAENIGFRRGTCFPFYLYNFTKQCSSQVLEIPLIVMDATLNNNKYMGVNQDEALIKVFSLIDEVKKFKGVFTLLWHNTFFSEYKYTGWQKVYIKILEYCEVNNALLTNGRVIYNIVSKSK